MSANDLDNFVTAVVAGALIPDPGTMFNPWGDHDPLHDIDADAPRIRADHLHRYLAARLGLNEKTLALDTAQRLKKLLEGQGFHVLLTRTENLGARTATGVADA